MMEKQINISASDLLKKSAFQICYLRIKALQKEPTERMLKGNEEAERKSISELKEMRGTYVHNAFLLHYTFDEIRVNEKNGNVLLIEHKMIENGSLVENWYIENSILQIALYHSLLKLNPNKEYFTAKFYRKLGYNTNYFEVAANKKITSHLLMGDKVIEVGVKNPKALVDFFIKKAISTFDYTSAKDFDLKYKRKEFQLLKKHIVWQEK